MINNFPHTWIPIMLSAKVTVLPLGVVIQWFWNSEATVSMSLPFCNRYIFIALRCLKRNNSKPL